MSHLDPPETPEFPCEACGRGVDSCICPECPKCGTVGSVTCIQEHGLPISYEVYKSACDASHEYGKEIVRAEWRSHSEQRMEAEIQRAVSNGVFDLPAAAPALSEGLTERENIRRENYRDSSAALKSLIGMFRLWEMSEPKHPGDAIEQREKFRAYVNKVEAEMDARDARLSPAAPLEGEKA